MVDSTAYRKFVGNVCLYRELSVREPPTFLRRNLNQALDAHERLLAQDTTKGPRLHADMVANERRSAGWDYPTYEMLQDLLRGQKPVLKIDALQLRLLGSKESSVWKTSRSRQADDVPSWLPDCDVEFRIPCQVVVSVLEVRSSRRAFFTQPQLSIAIGRKDENGELYCDVELEKPYLIELDKLFVVQDSGSNGFRHWKRTVTVGYLLEVSLQCQDSDDTAALLSRLETRSLSDYQGAPPNEGIIKAVWEDLPDCPHTGKLLSLKRPKGHKSLEMHYGLDISMGWSRRSQTPLQALNGLRNRESHQLPTPSASDDSERASKRIKVHYEFDEGLQTRMHDAEDLRCLFCEGIPESDSVLRLLLHYKISHEHFNFDLSECPKDGGQEQVKVVISLAEKPIVLQGASDAKNPVHHDWVAPQRPFNISAYVGGDESWTGGSRAKLPNKRGRPPKTKDAEHMNGNGVAAAAAKLSAQPLRDRENLAEVRELPKLGPKKHEVPVVPGVTFYHTKSKKAIEPGETISEDEDEGVDLRLAQSQYRNMKEHGLSHVAAEFHETFNQYLDTEQSASKTLIREGIVRFARKYKVKLPKEWQTQFEAKLKHLEAHGVIGPDVLSYCRTVFQQDQEQSNPGADRQLDDGDVEMTDALTPSDRLTNGDGTASQRLKGKFAKRSGDSAQSTPTASSKKSKKPHKWSGGGADREIIRNGVTQFFPDTASETPIQDPGSDDPMRVRQRAKTSDVLETPTPSSTARKPGRTKRDSGDVRAHGESARSRSPSGLKTPKDDAERLGPPNGLLHLGDGTTGMMNGATAKGTLSKGSVVTGRCVCGKVAEGGRECLACDNPHCRRGSFHLPCVGLEKRVMGWKCTDCSG